MRNHALPGARSYPGILRPTNTAQARRPPSKATPAGEHTQPEARASASPSASPLVRRLAASNAIELDQITGSGVGGRITAADVRQAASDRLSAIYAQSGGAEAKEEQQLYNRLFGTTDPAPPASAADTALYNRLFGTNEKQS